MSEPTEDMTKAILLQKLQKRIHFEKTITTSTAANYSGPCSMALPKWFVVKHGDQLQKSVLLWSGSSTEPWRVQLNVGSVSRDKVKLSGGLKRFATANGLVVGDLLVFCLRVMSEFDVYVFRETRSPIQPSSIQAPRKRSNDSELSEAKVNKSVGPRSRNLAADRCAGGVIPKTEEDKTTTGSEVKQTPVRNLQQTIFFETTLTPSATTTRCRLTLPQAFVKQHGDKFQRQIVLQTVSDGNTWNVEVHIYYPPRTFAHVWLEGSGWKSFVVSNGLVAGDRLTFTLVAMSKFQVLILRSRGNTKAGPVRQSKGSAFSRTRQRPRSLGQQHINMIGKCSVQMQGKLRSKQFAEKVEDADQGSVAHSASDSSQPFQQRRYLFEQ